ncbi:hypothetical protein UFOVP92_50 [uncultured Caudovirales phage]|uniref:Uncharacterized protein n=1 Tax=uncultured Caudovirales phage TaxID=2100421 RepID=A0A6J5L2X8_9CAUD|nr:hypothetical protein UFOVP92_50 [uncultured Caudovirales phage]
MSNVKMPEPVHITVRNYKEVNFYSHEQMKQYGDDRAREMLEAAAQLFEPAITPSHGFTQKQSSHSQRKSND